MNTEKIAGYIRAGAKKSENTGLELEHFIVDSNGKGVEFYGESGVCAILEEISSFFDVKVYSEQYLISLANDDYCITLEPAAQLEISIRPCKTIKETEFYYNSFLKLLQPVLLRYGYRLETLGYRRNDKIEELPLIPKKRYELMDKYFQATGIYGRNMMRGTASAQVSIDYSDEKDCIKKMRLANTLSPIFALITDNSPFFEGEKYDKRMLRTKIWSSVDNERCGIVPGSMDDDFSIEKYAEYMLKVPVILVETKNGTAYTGDKKLSDIYSDRAMTVSEIEHALSMFFPDVRLKTYIEIRPGDSMPIEYTLSYAAFVKGIFLSTDLVCEYFDISKIACEDISNAKNALINDGFEAVIYDKKICNILDFLMLTAESSLPEEDKEYLSLMKNIINTKTTLKEGFFYA